MLAYSEVEQGNTGYSDVRSGLGREILSLKLERGMNDMHLLFPCMEIITVFKRSRVCLSFLTNACLPLRGFWALYDSVVCICLSFMKLALVHFSLLPQQQQRLCDTVMMLSWALVEDLNAAHSSCLFSRLLLETNKRGSDALMMQTIQVLARDSLGLLGCLTDTAGDDTEMVNETLF